MNAPQPRDQNLESRDSAESHSGRGGQCPICDGQLGLLVHVEPQTNGRPVTYYACERCEQILVRKN